MSDSDTPKRVLFVEDAFDQALLVKGFLSKAGGFDVTHTQDGDHAVKLLQEEKWDLLISDLNLPGTDGFDVIRAGRIFDTDLPILATTGYTSHDYQEQALRAGANELMQKPLAPADFMGTVARLVGDPSAGGGPTDSILAVAGLAGDAIMGCGGALRKAAATGRTVVVLPLTRNDLDIENADLTAAKAALRGLSVRLVVDEAALDDTTRRVQLMEKAVRDLRPSVVYLPALDETHPGRMEAFRVANTATASVPTVLGYQTSTTGLDFKPDHYVDIAEELPLKKAALETMHSNGTGRVDLRPDFADVYARYWGRYHQFGHFEAFEIIKGRP